MTGYREKKTGSRHRVRKQEADEYSYVQSVLDRLRVLKNTMSYAELSSKSGVDSTLLCRYVTGKVRPSLSRCILLEEKLLSTKDFQERLREKILIKQNGYLDLHELLCDSDALRWISGLVRSHFKNMKIDRVLTAASSGIALATSVALMTGASVVYATHTKTSGPGSYFESEIPSTNPSEIFSLYLPVSWLKKGDRILLVDDVATSGRTMVGLVNIVEKAGCELMGIFVLVSMANEWKAKIEQRFGREIKTFVLFDLAKESILQV
ncbi:MAG: phosphoribosyltransferase family protein [Conexivisphaerales archaeon]